MDARTTDAAQGERAEGSSVEPVSAAESFLRQLHRSGIDYFFNNGGTDFPPIAEAFARALADGTPVPRPIVVPHENLAVGMAHGVYMVSGRPQAVMVHVNVGTANTINAILDASRDYTPILLFAGRSPYSEAGRHGTRTRYIHWAQEMFDQAGMLREAVKWDYELHLPEQAADLVSRGLQVAMTSPRGPVYASLPRDVLAAPVTVSRAAPRLAPPAPPQPCPADLDKLAAWIAAAERPVIVTAAAGRTPAGFAALDGFARRESIPVVSFHARFLNIASDHPMNLGELPGPLLGDADLVIALDCDVPWIPTTDAPPAECRVVHIGEDPAYVRYPMRSFPTDLCVSGETATVLDELGTRLHHHPTDEGRIASRAARAAERRTRLHASAPTSLPNTITPEWLSARIGEAVGPDAIIVNEYPLRLAHCHRSKAGTYFGLSAAGGLGWGFGAALGAKLADRDRLVVATLGDGAYMFANPTAAHWMAQAENLPVLTIVFNNTLYGAVRNSTLAMYRDGIAARTGGRILADLSPSPAFEKLVEASGGRGFRVERPDELDAALGEAIKTVTVEGRQALVNVICDY